MLVISNHNSFRVLLGNTASVYIFALHGGVKCKILKRAETTCTTSPDHAPFREDFSSAGWDLLW